MSPKSSSDPSTPSSRQPQADSFPSAARDALRVLIVEDDLTSANALRSILTRKGCEVHIAVDLAGGLRMLELRPDHIILDLMLPDGSGIEILRRLRDVPGGPKVTVTTALADPVQLQQMRALQPHRILRKPIDLVDLLGAIGMI